MNFDFVDPNWYPAMDGSAQKIARLIPHDDFLDLEGGIGVSYVQFIMVLVKLYRPHTTKNPKWWFSKGIPLISGEI